MKRGVLAALLLLAWGCSDDDPPAADAGADAGSDAQGGASADADASAEAGRSAALSPLPAACANDTAVPPRTLECTGLYAALASKELALQVLPFTPAVPLWSDGADKQRWIFLPPGTKIDNSDPNEWKFPVGTKLWKEFSSKGQRIETRLWQKVRDGFWVKTTYAWNHDESAAVASGGGDIKLADGSLYHIPTADECQQCHRGRRENILGFEQVSLGLAGASGVTLADLVAEDRLLLPLAATSLAIGDDGTGTAAPALAWMHVNCGTTCHNGNSNAVAYPAGMVLRLDPRTLDGRPVNELAPLKTTLAVPARNPNWSGSPRIVAGQPEASLLYQLISMRGVANQMPPIATNLIDTENVALIADWIRKLPPPPPPDAGPPDAALDARAPDAEVDAAETIADVGLDTGGPD